MDRTSPASGAARREGQHLRDPARADFAQRYDELFVTNRCRSISVRALDNAYLDAHYKYTGDLSLYYRLYEHFDYDLPAVIDSINASESYCL